MRSKIIVNIETVHLSDLALTDFSVVNFLKYPIYSPAKRNIKKFTNGDIISQRIEKPVI